jgi:hypothetical protein
VISSLHVFLPKSCMHLSFPCVLYVPSISSQRPCVTFHNKLLYYVEEFSASPNPQAGGPPLLRCPRMLVWYIHRYPPSAIRRRAMQSCTHRCS